MELNQSRGGRFKNVVEVDTACETLVKYGGLVGHADTLRQQAQTVDQSGLRRLAAPIDFGAEQRRVIIANLRRAALDKKPAYGHPPVSPETAEHARAMLEPFGLLEPLHKRLFAKFVKTHQAPPVTRES